MSLIIGGFMNKIAVIVATAIAVCGIVFFKEGAGLIISSIPDPWQCDLPGPPASCYGNIIVGTYLGLMFYTVGTVLAPIGYVINQIVKAVKNRRP